ncbi:hypothetical protein CHGG_01096 [Chaetomium globosum CBS 148.51]|uniref:Uncharacterized protein n=1 Tax=Chaetomium globosum (strain ATCC 6205 / CBS 148.51 / DSM 1962 / NBRC 6347 / NRRL 1970) TaxID=306901 RepID=Q2HFA8_CHAGB|nr:uncharacterized protein CHGG_01096 [Chaetomium globosum CBS 148.51]EAQ92861.1 hypothetical protein CHGG_01096 [Chaetomium globosum CBS 148.51]
MASQAAQMPSIGSSVAPAVKAQATDAASKPKVRQQHQNSGGGS